MKKLLLIPIILFSLTLQLLSEEYYYVEFYRDLLNPQGRDYPHRRVEALSKAQYLPQVQKEEIRKIVVERDLIYISYADSFRDLWRLRYKEMWEPEVLIVVADTAKFYLRFSNTNIEIGFNEDVGVLHHVLQQLRETENWKAKKAFRDLTREIKEIKRQSCIKKEVEKQKRILKMAIKKALMKSASVIKNLYQNNSFV